MQFTNVYGPVRVEASEASVSLGGSSSVDVTVGPRESYGHRFTATDVLFTEHSSTVVEVIDREALVVVLKAERVDPLDGSIHSERVALNLSESTAASLCERLLDIERLDLNP